MRAVAPLLALLLTLPGGAQNNLPPRSMVPASDYLAARYYTQFGHALASWNCNDAARLNYQQALRRRADHHEARVGLARMLARLGDGQAAMTEIRQAVTAEPLDLEANILLAKLLLFSGDAPAAERLLQQMIARDPTVAEPHRLLAMCLLQRQEFREAELQLRQAIGLDLRETEAFPLLIGLLAQQERDDETIDLLRQLLERRPGDPAVLMQLADRYYDAEKFDQALAVGLKLVEAVPDDPRPLLGVAETLLRLNRPAAAAEIYAKVYETAEQPEAVLTAANALGQFYLERGLYGPAARYLNKVVSLRPELIPAWFTLANCYLQAGQWRPAADALRPVVRAQPGNPGLRLQQLDLLLRARAWPAARDAAFAVASRWASQPEVTNQVVMGLLNYGRASDAIVILDRLRARRPNDLNLGLMLHGAYQAEGRNEAADKLVLQLYQRHPKDIAVRHHLASLRFQRGQYEQVVELLEPLLSAGTIAPEAVQALAWTYQWTGRYGDAMELFTALAAQSGDRLYLRHAARQAELAGDWGRAGGIYQAVLETFPKHVPTLVGLARAAANLGDLDKASYLLQRVVELEPDHALALRTLGLVSEARGNYADAMKWYARQHEVDPANPYPAALLGDMQRAGGDFAAALETWHNGLLERPDNALLHRRLADAYRETNRWSEAMDHYYAAALRDRHDWASRLALADLAAEQSLTAESRRWWRDLIDLLPDSGWAYWRWLETFEREPELGAEAGWQLLGLRPNSPALASVLLGQARQTGNAGLFAGRVAAEWPRLGHQAAVKDLRGGSLAAAGEVAQALAWYEALAAEEPLNATWPRRRAALLLDANRPAEALTALDDALERQPADPLALSDLARARLAAGDLDGALEATARLLLADPHNDRAVHALVRQAAAQGLALEVWGRLGRWVKQSHLDDPWTNRVGLIPAVLSGYGLACEQLANPPLNEALAAYTQAAAADPSLLATRQRRAALVTRLGRAAPPEAVFTTPLAAPASSDEPPPSLPPGGAGPALR